MTQPIDQPEKFLPESLEITTERVECLRQIFPEVFHEGRVDFDALRRSLGDWVEPGREKFGLQWPGKAEVMKLVQSPTRSTFRPLQPDSVNFDESQNLILEGDNLEALKLLQKSYYGQVKMIYIDPPYNTGHDFIYPDDYTDSLQNYLDLTGQTDGKGRRYSTQSEASGRYHTNWLNMMYPRLYLARNLLRDDGVIFVSIDDNEQHHLRDLLNEVFGEENFISVFIWEKRTTRENRKVFSINHDYLICFAKEKSRFEESRNLLPLTEDVKSRYQNPDNDSRGPWQSVSLNAQAGHATASQFYVIETPSGRKLEPPPGRCWLVTDKRLKELISDNRIWFGSDGSNVPRQKIFLSEANQGLTPHTLWSASEVGTTDSAKKDLIELFGGNAPFETPKPVELIQRLCGISTSHDTDDLILDFFAGSGTTAHATLKLNAEDGGNRRFILVQLPEPTGMTDYPTIANITRERVRRAGQAITKEREGKLDLAGNPSLDLGFKAFRLDESGFLNAQLNPDGDLPAQIEAQLESVRQGRTPEDLLYEILLKEGFALDSKVEKLKLSGSTVYAIAEGMLLLCLEDAITLPVVEAMIGREPGLIMLRDSAFGGDDALKANALASVRAWNRLHEGDMELRVA